MYAHVLIPTDGSPLADQAVEKGVELARALGARATIMTVVEPFDVMRHFTTDDQVNLSQIMEGYERGAGKAARRILDAAAARAAAAGVEVATVEVQARHPHEAIVKQAEESGADLIVIASHGRSGVQALFVGSVTLKVLSHSRIPVHVLR